MSETLGIPLDMVVESMERNDMVIDWIEFVETALSVNWTIPRIFFKIETAFEDCYLDHTPVTDRIKLYLSKKE